MFNKKQPIQENQTTQTQKRSCGCSDVANSCSKDKTKSSKTRIIVKYDVGFNNTLYIRGKGANLSWERGLPLKNVKADEWVWETDVSFPPGEFKILINDEVYETGINHPLTVGTIVQYEPKF